MRTIIGIDPSSKKIAFCTTEGSLVSMHTTSLPEGVLHAAGVAFEEAFLFFCKLPKAKIFMEAPVMGPNAHSTIIQAQVGGAVLAAAHRAELDVELVNVNSWKKQVVGNGHAKKPEVSKWLEENWPKAYNLAAGDQDLIDASAINRYGYNHVRLAEAIISRSKRGKKVVG